MFTMHSLFGSALFVAIGSGVRSGPLALLIGELRHLHGPQNLKLTVRLLYSLSVLGNRRLFGSAMS